MARFRIFTPHRNNVRILWRSSALTCGLELACSIKFSATEQKFRGASAHVLNAHSPLGPCGPSTALWESPRRQRIRYASTALWSSALDCGENAPGGLHNFGDMDPDEPSNIWILLAFESTQAALQSWCPNLVAL